MFAGRFDESQSDEPFASFEPQMWHSSSPEQSFQSILPAKEASY